MGAKKMKTAKELLEYWKSIPEELAVMRVEQSLADARAEALGYAAQHLRGNYQAILITCGGPGTCKHASMAECYAADLESMAAIAKAEGWGS